ncbi:rhodanese-like domain-containing protein [Botrimarina sp.]|uniref:rhodanese-like domain-containing protein n=1 Tax=Botrimarina sp. TaxID=2795802 RepID=UPI0032EFBACF
MCPSVTPDELREALNNGDPTLIDVRTPAEFREVHVRGAQNVPLDRLKPERFRDHRGPLYVVCKSGSRSAKAGEQLQSAGVEQVRTVDGGTEACVRAGVEVVRGQKTMSLERQVRIAAGSLVVLGVLLGWLVHPGFYGLSAFVGAGLVFAGVTDTCGMGMLLARCPWNQASGCDGPSCDGPACDGPSRDGANKTAA